ncbi:MAG: 2-dehydropantoate 2-reductase [Cryomorphaceae bacterium]|jgi:2-dehydropantoate 2-reductase
MGKLGKIAVVGSGAIGIYYGARLVAAGEDVTFLLRSDFEHVREHGLRVDSVAGDFSLKNVKCEKLTSDIGKVDLVIISWKTTANGCAEEVITPLIGENTQLLVLQNGLGNCEYYAELFGAHRILGGLCFVCINRVSSGHVEHTASGLIRLGSYSGGKCPDGLIEACTQSGFPCEWVDSLEKAQWMKLVWNIPFNGLAIAEGGVDTAKLLGELDLKNELRALMNEVLLCAAAYGHSIDPKFIDHQIEITRPMGAYKPSSMIDYLAGLPVEVEAIWGEPLRRAKEKNVSVPRLELLYDRISKLLS